MASKRSEPSTTSTDAANVNVSNVSVVLLDIEGTTTSISFVKDELFPYIQKNVETYLDAHFDEDITKDDIEALRQQAIKDIELKELDDVISISPDSESKEEVIKSAVENVRWQMSLDRKTTALKQLQGHMWQDAYKAKEVKGHLYEDVTECLKKWKKNDKFICIYSSGSVAAQKLLFTYSVDGDITEILSEHFDTKIGMKREVKSYVNICEQLKVEPETVLFLTDVYEEAEAAKEAGVQCILTVRPGNAPLTEEQAKEFPTVTSFEQITFGTEEEEEGVESKKSKLESEAETVESS